ncbi:MAG TPA: hypothetical protein VK619_05970 [Pyrinomonadaceae bacterium]|nr:hypothetical protein [Pyrinomonadaceae bacterium]
MKTARAITLIVVALLFAATPLVAQQRQGQNADLLKQKIEQLERIDLASKSSTVQDIYKRSLLRLYMEYQAAMQQDVADLNKIRTTIGGTSAETLREVNEQIQKLAQEISINAEKIQTLAGELQVAVTVPVAAPSQPAPAAADAQMSYASYNRPTAAAPAASLPAAPDSSRAASISTQPIFMSPASPSPVASPSPSPLHGVMGLLLGGVVVSQQARNFSQADPFFGFIVGYDSLPRYMGGTLHYRVQGIFNVQPQTAQAPAASASPSPGASPTPSASPTPTPTLAGATFPFLASRKTFDIDTHMWLDWPVGSGYVHLGPYLGIGASTFINPNELSTDQSSIATAGGLLLDPRQARASDDLKRYYEFGLIANFFGDDDATQARSQKSKLWMQTQMLYGNYEALAGLYPGHDTRKRFIGRLRFFPKGLNLGLNALDMRPMFGVELNAGRGPDQLRFFTGIALSVRCFHSLSDCNRSDSSGGGNSGSGTGSGATGSGTALNPSP